MVFLRTKNCSVLDYSSLDFLDILDISHRKDIHLGNIFLVIGLSGGMDYEVKILVNTDDCQVAKMALVAQGASDSRLYFDNTAESVFVRWNLILNDNRSFDFGFVTEIVIAHVVCHSPGVSPENRRLFQVFWCANYQALHQVARQQLKPLFEVSFGIVRY